MRVLHLLYESKGDYFGLGGVGVRAYEIYSRLKGRMDVTLLCKRYPGAMDSEIEGLRHIFVGSEGRSFTRSLISYSLEAARFVHRWGEQYDIIVEEFSPAIPTLLFFYKKRPLVLQIQGYTGSKYFKKYLFPKAMVLAWFERLFPRMYKAVISVSDTTLKRYSLKKGALVRVIPNGIAGELLTLPIVSGDYILYLGRLDLYNKGIDLLLQAYSKLCKEIDRLPLVIAGDFRDSGPVMRLIDSLPEGVRNNIKMTGWVGGKEKVELLRDAMMVVVPSRHETQGIVALEAMASAKPLIVSNIPELQYVVEAGAGVSFESEDPEDLFMKMKQVLSSNNRQVMGDKGRSWVKSFAWEDIALKYEDFLLKVIKRHRGSQ